MIFHCVSSEGSALGDFFRPEDSNVIFGKATVKRAWPVASLP